MLKEKETKQFKPQPKKAGQDHTKQFFQGQSNEGSFFSVAPTIQKKTTPKVDEVPEKVKEAEKGPVAVKGKGDSHEMSASDINQGSIGDCFFLAGLGAVAHNKPSLLKKAIKDNGDGTYNVTLYKRKGWFGREYGPAQSSGRFASFKKKTVRIKATFPKSVNGNDTANSDTSSMQPHALGGDKDSKGNAEIWVRLVEKAYAQMSGGYAAIGNGGFGESALEALTGENYTEKAHRNITSVKDRLIEASEKGEPTVVSTKSQGDIEKQSKDLVKFADKHDIVGGHAYTLIKADKNSIQIRNPWGKNASTTTPTMTWNQFSAFFKQTSLKR